MPEEELEKTMRVYCKNQYDELLMKINDLKSYSITNTNNFGSAIKILQEELKYLRERVTKLESHKKQNFDKFKRKFPKKDFNKPKIVKKERGEV